MVPKRTARPLATAMESVDRCVRCYLVRLHDSDIVQRCAARCEQGPWSRLETRRQRSIPAHSTKATGGTPIPASRILRGRTHCAHRASASQQSGVIPAAVPGGVEGISCDHLPARRVAQLAPGMIMSPKPYQPIALLSLRPHPTDYAASTGFDQLDCTDHRSALAVLKLSPGFDCTFGSLTSALAPP
ncbi:hypothetical protein B0H17DRAFT_1182576 [Mycena rosella]|uniref:Uncharacterized protein n=1 Tax=Mycena rosella TaxID=1033263 RepID=A0AAD7GC72_MYCRO|nr:hypothetical protein B0H17DRAFT_1182576 [Mycena rosella]